MNQNCELKTENNKLKTSTIIQHPHKQAKPENNEHNIVNNKNIVLKSIAIKVTWSHRRRNILTKDNVTGKKH